MTGFARSADLRMRREPADYLACLRVEFARAVENPALREDHPNDDKYRGKRRENACSSKTTQSGVVHKIPLS